MAFVRTVPEDEASGELEEMYQADRLAKGYVPNYTRVLSIRPGIMKAYRAMGRAIRSGMELRRYELITAVVAARLRCTY